MVKEDQRKVISIQRKELIEELEAVYKKAFDRIGSLNLREGSIAKLTQLLLQSREAAITPLQKEIERPIITMAPEKK